MKAIINEQPVDKPENVSHFVFKEKILISKKMLE